MCNLGNKNAHDTWFRNGYLICHYPSKQEIHLPTVSHCHWQRHLSLA